MFEMLLKSISWRTLVAGLLLGVLVILKLFRLVDKTQFKSALLWSATVGRGKKASLKLLKKIVDEKISPLWFGEMKNELEQLRASGHRICYVSASGEPWLRFLLRQKDSGAKIIVGSKLMSFCYGITLRGENCLGSEKIIRLRKILPTNIIWSVAYSDHRADLPLLLACRKRVVVNPTEKNKRTFQKILGLDGFTEVKWQPENAGL